MKSRLLNPSQLLFSLWAIVAIAAFVCTGEHTFAQTLPNIVLIKRRRSRLRRFGMLRRDKSSHAQHRSVSHRGATVYGCTLDLRGLFAFALWFADGSVSVAQEFLGADAAQTVVND